MICWATDTSAVFAWGADSVQLSEDEPEEVCTEPNLAEYVLLFLL
jgi:hypothetical protein